MEFDCCLDEVPVKIKGPKGVDEFVLRELTGDGRDDYSQEVSTKCLGPRDDKGRREVVNVRGMRSALLSRSLISRKNGEYASSEYINSLPSDVREKLYLRSRELSKLDAEEPKVQESDLTKFCEKYGLEGDCLLELKQLLGLAPKN
jgi:hypothetical protein